LVNRVNKSNGNSKKIQGKGKNKYRDLQTVLLVCGI